MAKTIARGFLALFGVFIVAYTLFADQKRVVGIERGSFGQFVVVLIGAMTVAFALTAHRLRAKKISNAYTQIAVILLNTLLCFLFVELMVIFSFNLQFQAQDASFVPTGDELDVFTDADQAWRTAYAEDMQAVDPGVDYQAYSLWRRTPYEGTAIHIDANGLRVTPGADCSEGAYRIFIYGGSTLWGFGAADGLTIPAYLQAELNEAGLDRPICVQNWGELAFVSSQEVIELMKSLQHGDVPDMVIFYDGVNDVIAANQHGIAGNHRLYNVFDDVFGNDPSGLHPLVRWLMDTYTVRFLRALSGADQDTTSETGDSAAVVDEASLAQEVVDLYLNNIRMVDAWADEYGFEALYFWQPTLAVESKPRTDQEDALVEVIPTELRDLFTETYAIMHDNAPNIDNLRYIADVFNDTPQMIYMDYVHPAYPGNAVIAQAMRDSVIERIQNDNP